MCVSYTGKIKGRHGGVCLSSSLSRRPLLVCVCMYMYDNTAERLRLNKAVSLLLFMKYFILIIFSYSHTTTPCNIHSSPQKENYSQNTLTIAPQAQKADACYKFYKIAAKNIYTVQFIFNSINI